MTNDDTFYDDDDPESGNWWSPSSFEAVDAAYEGASDADPLPPSAFRSPPGWGDEVEDEVWGFDRDVE